MRRNEHGATIVEAAIVLPIVFMFLMGILEFGRAYNEYQVLTNAAREAARFAVAPTPGMTGTLPTTAQVQQIATNWLNSAGVTPSAPPTVSTVVCGSFTNPITGNANPQNCTTVTVSAPFTFLASQLMFGNARGAINLQSTSTMRQETNSDP